MPVTISPEPFDSPVSRALVQALDDFLNGLYELQESALDVAADEFTGIRGTFLVARECGTAVGCGGIRLISSETAEVKRMFVAPPARGRRIASRILEDLESWAARAGATRLVVETGIHQGEAMRLYEGFGYVEIPGFGPYAESGVTRCFEKIIEVGGS